MTAAPALPASGAAALCATGRALRVEGRYLEAEAVLVRALALAECSVDVDERLVVEAANELGVLYKYTARFDEAEALYRRALLLIDAFDDSTIAEATLWHNVGGLEHSRGRFALAEVAARRAVELRVCALGPDHLDVALDQAALAAILDALGRLDEAEALLRPALRTFVDRYGERHYEVAVAANNLAAVCFRRGDRDESRELWARSLRIKREVLGSAHPELAPTLVNLGVLASASGDDVGARRLFEEALEVLGPDAGEDHPARRSATASLARLRDDSVWVSTIEFATADS